MKDCQLCPLAKDRRQGEQPVPPSGPGTNGLLVLAQGPGSDEMKAGAPLVGMTGSLFRDWISLIGIKPEECWLWNVTQCMPHTPKLNRAPTVPEVRTCTTTWVWPWVRERANHIKLILALGGPACEALTGMKVTVARGKAHKCIVPGLEELRVFPTWHPSAVHRDFEGKLSAWLDDLAALKFLLGGGSDVQTTYRLVESGDGCCEGGRRDRATTLAYVALDTETTGLREDRIAILGVAISHKPGEGTYHVGTGAWRGGVAHAIKDFGRRIFHNAPYDLGVLQHNGYEPERFLPFEDTMLAAHVLGWSSKGLKALALSQLGIEQPSLEDVSGKPADFWKLHPHWEKGVYIPGDLDRAASYAATDAVVTLRLWKEVMEPAFIADPEARACYELDRDLIVPILHAQERGIQLDKEATLQEVELCGEWARRIAREVGFNPGSRSQCVEAFNSFGWVGSKRTNAGEVSVDEAVLLEIAPWAWLLTEDMVVEPPPQTPPLAVLAWKVLQYRRLVKARGYLKRWVLESEYDGRVRTHQYLTRVRTPRMSSGGPVNLQQVMRPLRSAFVAAPGHMLVAFDFSQIELRTLAELSGDETFINKYRRGEDIHQWMQDRSGVPERRVAKTLNFGLVFGARAPKLAEVAAKPLAWGEDLEAALKAEVPALMNHRYAIGQFLMEHGYARSEMGRKRYFLGVRSWGRKQQSEALRMAMSQNIQGTAAEILKRGLLAVSHTRWINYWLLAIHDELMFEVPDEEVRACIAEVKPLMEGVAPHWCTPIVCEAKTGRDWGHMESVKCVP